MNTMMTRTPFTSSKTAYQHRALAAPICPTAQLRQRCPPSQHSTARAAPSQRGVRLCVQASSDGSAPWDPPTVAVTKRKFLDTYPKPVPGLYDAVIQELLVQQHLIRYNKKYQYNPVTALGFVSVFDQVLEGLPKGEQDTIFAAYIGALDESPEQYRSDAAAWEEWVKGLSGPEELKPDASGSEQQQVLARLADGFANKSVVYSKFLAIGLFRLLELSGAKEPKALETLVKSLNARPEAVQRDLVTYKGVLSKLSAAKELMKEILAREKKKQAEREAGKDELTKAAEKGEGEKGPKEEDALAGKTERALN